MKLEFEEWKFEAILKWSFSRFCTLISWISLKMNLFINLIVSDTKNWVGVFPLYREIMLLHKCKKLDYQPVVFKKINRCKNVTIIILDDNFQQKWNVNTCEAASQSIQPLSTLNPFEKHICLTHHKRECITEKIKTESLHSDQLEWKYCITYHISSSHLKKQ